MQKPSHKTFLGLISGVGLMVVVSGASYPLHASTPSTMVFVGQNVTRSQHYTITYTDYAHGHVLWTRTMPAPPGSLIAVHAISLKQAQAAHDVYVPIRGSAHQRAQEISHLHQLIAQQSRRQTTENPQAMLPAIQPMSSMVATGSFNTYHNAWADYSIKYNNDTANGTLNVTHYSVWLTHSPSSLYTGIGSTGQETDIRRDVLLLARRLIPTAYL